MTIKAVLFDFGGVFTVSPFGAVEALAAEQNVDPVKLRQAIFGSYDEDNDHPWHQLERGELSLEETRDAVLEQGRREGIEADLWLVFGKMAEHNKNKVINEEVVDLLVELKQQDFVTAMLTNNILELGDGWKSMLPMDHIDHVFDSCHMKVRKPDERIFTRALEALKLDGEQCLFLDDVESNTRAANKLGINTILVTPDPKETVLNTRNFLGIS